MDISSLVATVCPLGFETVSQVMEAVYSLVCVANM